MLSHVLELLWWFQMDAAPADGGGPAGEGGAPPGCGGMNLVFLVGMLAVFYFVLIRPQQKREKERQGMLDALRRGDVVRTSGGIKGEIVRINEREAVLAVADRVRINVLRANIAGVEGKQQEESEDKGSKKSDDTKAADQDQDEDTNMDKDKE